MDDHALAVHAAELALATYEREHVAGTLARRDQHGLTHGCVTAKLRVVAADVPEDLRHGLFATDGLYEAVVRFSPNGHLPWRDAHGMAIKILDVGGRVQDFILANTDTFFARDAASAVELVQARAGPPLRSLARYFVPSVDPRKWRPRELRNMIKAITRRVSNPLTTAYYSQLAIRCGPTAVKIMARPMRTGLRPKGNPRDLAGAMRTQLETRSATFSLMLQPRQPGDSIEDPTRPWRGPWVHVAELWIPAQVPGTGEHMEWTLAHCLPEHEALGGIAEVRRVVYEAIAARRHELNGVPRDPRYSLPGR